MSEDVWDIACHHYLLFRGRDRDEAEIAVRRACRCLPDDDERGWDWMATSLLHDRRRWFVAAVLEQARRVPEALLGPMLVAALREPRQELCRPFIEPCVGAYGPLLVRECLLEAFERGDD